MRRLPASLLALASSLAACGDDLDGAVDVCLVDGCTPDATPVDAPPTPGVCDFAELRDLTNDDIVGAGTPELTNATLATSLTLCGAIDAGHLDVAEAVVDADGYTFAVATETDLLVTLSGAGLEALELVQLQLYGGGGLNMIAANTRFVGDHAVFSLHVLPGSYELAVIASSTVELASPIAYQIRVGVDAPATRCAALTTGGYTEATDGAQSDGNDVVGIDRSMNPTNTLTASTTDAPEPTGVVVAPATSYRLVGTSANVARVGSYFDKDTFAFTTGPATNQVAIRLNWPGATVDLDYHVYAEGQVPYLYRSIAPATMEAEFQTFAVEPSTNYWLWVGADYVMSTGLPVTYAATVCGATFAP